MFRRDFLARLAGSATSAAMGSTASAFARSRKHSAAPSLPPKLDRIALSTWSLHNYFRSTRVSTCTLPGSMLVLLDLPEMIYDRYHIRHFDLCASHFPSTEQAYLHELKYMLTHTQSNVVNLSVDVDACGPEGTFSDPDREARLAALDLVRPWVDVAHTLGAKSVSIGPGKFDREFVARTAESYKAVANYALAQGVHVVLENQTGFGDEHPEDLTKLVNLVGPGRLGSLPNFSNFADAATRTKALKSLFPSAQTVCHATGLEAAGDGAGKGFDFCEAVEIAKQSSFRGYYSIEFDGPGDPYAGIQKTLDELMECI